MAMYILCFLLPLLGAFRINLVGELSFADPLVLVLSVVFLRRFSATWYNEPLVRQITLLAILWLVAQIGSDIFRRTDYIDYLRGWFRILILIASFVVFSIVVGTNLNRAVCVIVGIVTQPVVNYYIHQREVPIYKFVFGFLVSLCAFIIARAFGGHRQLWPVIFPFGAAAVALFFDCRSLAGITFCAGAYYSFLAMGLVTIVGDWKRRAFYGGVWVGLAASIVQVYVALAAAGHLSEEALLKYEIQLDSFGQFSLMSGRSEIMFSGPKIMESPIIGWGSWVKDAAYVGERAEALGMDPAKLVFETGGIIPAHSHLFGSWLEAGIFGAIFWMVVWFHLFKILASGSLNVVLQWSGVFAFAFIAFGWDILFSPFGGERRLNDGFYLWLISLILIISLRRSPQKTSKLRLGARVRPSVLKIEA